MKGKVKLKGRLNTYLQLNFLLGSIFVVFAIWMFFINIKCAVILSIGIVLYFLVVFLFLHFNKSIIERDFVDFATQYGQIQRRLLRELELPHALLDAGGKVIWTNEAFEKCVHQEKGYRKSITNLFPTITKDKLPMSADTVYCDASFEDRQYSVSMKRIYIDELFDNCDMLETENYEGYLIATYFFDETEINSLLRKNDEQSPAVGIIYLDNYEEALESVEEVRRSLLVALIDRKINKYVSNLDGIVRKTEKDKYLLLMSKKSLEQMRESKFELIEDIKTVNIGNEMAVTASVGLGLGGIGFLQDYELARAAIDLALGRGGDQAVVKTPDQITYYGGKSQQVDKGTRVKARVKALALKEILANKDNVIVMGHRMSDVDSFGAALGIACIARVMDKKAHIVLNDITSSLRPLVDAVNAHPDFDKDLIISNANAHEMVTAGTVLVVVDVNRPSITECPDLIKACKSIVVLDHHRQTEDVVENPTLSYIEPYASSACEMVAEILQYVDDSLRLNTVEADCLYAGIVIDTNNFTAKAGVRTFEAAAFLKRSGADVARVRKLFREKNEDYKAKAQTIKEAEIFLDCYAISVCHSEGLESPTIIAAQAANDLLDINNIKASFVLTEHQNRIHISARSIDEVNVQIVMERLGGGGHMSIAATQLEGVTLEEAIKLLKEVLTKMTQEGDI